MDISLMDISARSPERALATQVAAGLERLVGLIRSLSPPSGLSLTATSTLATLERSGPCRLTSLTASQGVTQPAMTQLIARLREAGLAERAADPGDGRIVQIRITADGRALVARRRAARAERLAGLLAQLSPEEQAALAAALPAIEALASAPSARWPPPASSPNRTAVLAEAPAGREAQAPVSSRARDAAC